MNEKNTSSSSSLCSLSSNSVKLRSSFVILILSNTTAATTYFPFFVLFSFHSDLNLPLCSAPRFWIECFFLCFDFGRMNEPGITLVIFTQSASDSFIMTYCIFNQWKRCGAVITPYLRRTFFRITRISDKKAYQQNVRYCAIIFLIWKNNCSKIECKQSVIFFIRTSEFRPRLEHNFLLWSVMRE